MKNKTYIIAAVVLAVLLAAGTFFYLNHQENTESVPDLPGISDPIEQPGGDASSAPSGFGSIPDMLPGEDSSPRIYEKKDLNSLSPTTLSENEIIEEIEKILTGLLTLDNDAISKISEGTFSGEYNPTRYMLEAASHDNDLRAFFLKAGAVSSFRVVDISGADDYPNMYTIRVECKTPFIQSEAQKRASMGQTLYYAQQTVPFSGSGAAKAIADMDLNSFPIMTDIVSIGVLVEDDVPYMYHPISENYGSRIPQYAFLWGGIIFQGINNSDLLIENYLGGMMSLNENDVESVPRAAAVNAYANSVMDSLRAADFDVLKQKVFGDANLQDEWFFTKVLPAYEKAMEQYDGFRNDCLSRLESLEYKVSVYSTLENAATPFAAIQIEYSVKEASTGGTAYYTAYHVFDMQRKSEMKGFDAQMINSLMSDIMERAIGGDRNQLEIRLRAR